MSNRTLARALLPVALLLAAIYGSYRRIPPVWVPYIETVELTSGGVDRSIRLSDTSMIPVAYEKSLKVLSISGRLALVDRKWILGPIGRIGDIPQPPWKSGDFEMRATVMARKHGIGPRSDCFDSKDALQSEWVPIPAGRWNITFPNQEWMVGPEWEAIKVIIETRNLGGDNAVPAIFPTGGTYILDFAAQEGTAGLKRRTRTSIISTIARKSEKCP